MCRPCPAGTWMDKEGATHNNAGEAGECNACPSPAHMTNVFPAYTQDQCAKCTFYYTTNSSSLLSSFSIMFPKSNKIPSRLCTRLIRISHSTRLH